MRKVGRPPRPWDAERLITYLPKVLKRRLEHLAVRKQSTVTAIVTEAVRRYLRHKH